MYNCDMNVAPGQSESDCYAPADQCVSTLKGQKTCAAFGDAVDALSSCILTKEQTTDPFANCNQLSAPAPDAGSACESAWVSYAAAWSFASDAGCHTSCAGERDQLY
jgi:hypothetical protein